MSNGFFGGVKALVSYFSSAERMTTSLAQSSPAPQISKIRLRSYLQKRASENFGSLVFFQKLIIIPFRVSVRVSKQWVELVCTYGFPHSLSDWFNGSNVSKTQFSFVTHLRQQNQSPSLLRWTRPRCCCTLCRSFILKWNPRGGGSRRDTPTRSDWTVWGRQRRWAALSVNITVLHCDCGNNESLQNLNNTMSSLLIFPIPNTCCRCSLGPGLALALGLNFWLKQ